MLHFKVLYFVVLILYRIFLLSYFIYHIVFLSSCFINQIIFHFFITLCYFIFIIYYFIFSGGSGPIDLGPIWGLFLLFDSGRIPSQAQLQFGLFPHIGCLVWFINHECLWFIFHDNRTRTYVHGLFSIHSCLLGRPENKISRP